MTDIILRPHAGQQEAFLASGEDVVFYGGGAGGGKTFALLLDQGRWASRVRGFTGAFFRRTYPEIMNPGGLWDEASQLFPHIGGVPIRSETKWIWPTTGSWIKFSHLQYEDSVRQWQGAQLAAIAFDELTHFHESQFWYMLSRLRSKCGVRPYFRGTCNPDPMSWVKDLIKPWLNDDGFARRQKKTLHMGRVGGKLVMDEKKDVLIQQRAKPLSFSFIPALVTDNPALLRDDPDYLSKLDTLSAIDRARLRDGNWKVVAKAGSFFRREWFTQILPVKPNDVTRWIRYWDRAATEPNESNKDPDWTRGVLIGRSAQGPVVANVASIRGSPGTVENFIVATAKMDGKHVEPVMEQDPGQAGVVEVANYIKELAGYPVRRFTPRGHKADRAKPVSAQAEAGNVRLVEGPWISDFLNECESFVDNREVDEPAGYHDDQVDAFSGGYNFLYLDPTPRVRTI